MQTPLVHAITDLLKNRKPCHSTPNTTPMKNAFIVSSLILTVAYSVAVVATTLGIVLFNLPSVSSAIGAYAALGVLAFAFRDYARQPRSEARPSLAHSPHASGRGAVHPLSLTNATLHAN